MLSLLKPLKNPIIFGYFYTDSVPVTSKIDFDANTTITINQQSPEIKSRSIFGITEMAGDGEVL